MKSRPAPKSSSPKRKKTADGKRKASVSSQAPALESWNLRLYVAGQTPRSIAAFANLKRLCEEHLAGRYHIEVIDLAKHPHLAQSDQIVAIPTLVRKLPEPIKRVVGDLSNVEKVVVGMDLQEIVPR